MDPRLEVNKTLITGYLDLVKPKVREEVLADVVKDGKVDKEALACLIDKAAASISSQSSEGHISESKTWT